MIIRLNPYICLLHAFSYLQKQAQEHLGSVWATNTGAMGVLLQAMQEIVADHDRARKEWRENG